MLTYFCHQCRKKRNNTETILVDEIPICNTCHNDFLEEINDDNRQELQLAEGAGSAGAAIGVASGSLFEPHSFLARHLQEHGEREQAVRQHFQRQHALQHSRLVHVLASRRGESPQPGSSGTATTRESPFFRPISARPMFDSPVPQQQQPQSARGHMAFEHPRLFFWDLERDWERDLQMLHEMLGPGSTPPARPADLAQIQAVSVGSEQVGQQCTVCLDEFAEGDSADRLPCQHHFHSQCIRSWLEKCNSCPVCRKSLSRADAPTEAAADSAGAAGADSGEANSVDLQHLLRNRNRERLSRQRYHELRRLRFLRQQQQEEEAAAEMPDQLRPSRLERVHRFRASTQSDDVGTQTEVLETGPETAAGTSTAAESNVLELPWPQQEPQSTPEQDIQESAEQVQQAAAVSADCGLQSPPLAADGSFGPGSLQAEASQQAAPL